MNEIGGLPLDGGNYFGMTVPCGYDGYARGEIKKGIAVHVFHEGAPATPRNEGITSRIRRRDVASIQFHDASGIGPGDRCDLPWKF